MRADMSSLQYLNSFICERLTAAARDIFGAVEKTLIEYQGEMSRSQQEIDHLRTLVLRPEVRLPGTAARHCCDEEASPECCHDSERTTDVDHMSSLPIKEEPESELGVATEPPRFVEGGGHEEPPSNLHRELTVEQTAELQGDGRFISPSSREAEISCGINPESSGLQQETLTDRLHELDEQQDTRQEWSPCQDHKDPEAPQMKKEKLSSPGIREERHGYHFPSPLERHFDEEPQSSSPRHDRTLTDRIFYGAERKRNDAGGLDRAPQPFSLCKFGEKAEGVVDGGWMKALTRTRPKKRPNFLSFSEGGDHIAADEEDMQDLTRERRHTCPICAKRFKESSHLKEHLRIHTGEKPYQCKECGVKFRQKGALTAHMRIHTGERPFQCSDCGRRFNRKGDMETHRVIHTDDRPHLCVLCGRSFRRKSYLKTHLKMHAEENLGCIQPV